MSHHVRRLEEYLDVPLFERTRSRVKLTEAGAWYFTEIDPAIERIRRATGSMRRRPGQRRVTLTTMPSVVSTWLIPNWGSFEQACPDVELQLLATTRVVDLEREHVDLALRFGPGQWHGTGSRWLFPEHMVPVCAPGYLRGHDTRDPAAVLAASRLIVNETEPDEWATWAAAEGIPCPDLRQAVRFADGHQVLLAAQSGLGIALGRRPMVDPYLATNALAAPLGAARHSYGCYLCWPSGREMSGHVKAVAAWLEQLAEQVAPVERLLSDDT